MKGFLKFLSILILFPLFVNSQNFEKDVLFVINDKEKVYLSEFEYNFKSNQNLLTDDKYKDVKNYLELFILFKKKLFQAHELGLDTAKVFKEELSFYRNKLAQPYFKDQKEKERLIVEAFERSKVDLNVSHIMLRYDSKLEESKALIDRLNRIKKDVENGKISFEQAAQKYSEDPSVSVNMGQLGWMTAFTMVYPFENAVYNLNKGQISNVFRTKFGYHIAMLNDRLDNIGRVQLSHIIKYKTKNDSVDASNLELMISTRQDIAQGKDFFSAASSVSDDKMSLMNQANLPVSSFGRLMPEVNQVAYQLKEGEVSQVFESSFAYHIIKLNSKVYYTDLEKAKEELDSKLQKDGRYELLENSIYQELLTRFKVKTKDRAINRFVKDNSSKYKSSKLTPSKEQDNTLLIIENNNISAGQFAEYLQQNPYSSKDSLISASDILKYRWKEFMQKSVMDYYDNKLESLYPDFKDIIENYKQGILIYNLMNLKVWEKAKSDTLGQQNYFSQNKGKYMWPERAEVLIAKCFLADNAQKVKSMLEKGKSKEEIEKLMNQNNNLKVIFQQGLVAKNNSSLPDNFLWEKGVSKVYLKGENSYLVVKINSFVAPEQMSFDQAKSRLVMDYQNYLDEVWNSELNNDYSVLINQDLLNSLIKKYN